MTKSTASHHFKILLEAGIVGERAQGTSKFLHLRRAELDERFPGLLDSVLRATARRLRRSGLLRGGELAARGGDGLGRGPFGLEPLGLALGRLEALRASLTRALGRAVVVGELGLAVARGLELLVRCCDRACCALRRSAASLRGLGSAGFGGAAFFARAAWG